MSITPAQSAAGSHADDARAMVRRYAAKRRRGRIAPPLLLAAGAALGWLLLTVIRPATKSR